MWLSVMLPTYNGQAYVADALESILAQSDDAGLEDVEVIAVDDGSTDATVDILRAYQRRLHLTIAPIDRTGNWIANSNLALRRSAGKYVCWLHQDDFWRANRLSALRHVVEAQPDAQLIVHSSDFVDESGRDLGRWTCGLPAGPELLSASEALRVFAVHDPIAASSSLVRRDAIDVVGEPDDTLWYFGDWEFWLRLVALGRTVCCPHALSAFRIHRESQTALRTCDTDEIRGQFNVVDSRHLRDLGDSNLRRVSRLSFEIDICLMRIYHGMWPNLSAGVSALRSAGLRGLLNSLSDSGITQRVGARLRACVRHHFALRGSVKATQA